MLPDAATATGTHSSKNDPQLEPQTPLSSSSLSSCCGEPSAANADPQSPFQRRLFALCVLAWATLASFWFTGIQFLLPAVKGKWGVSSRWQGAYASLFYAGMTLGGAGFGWLSDRHGRRPALLACAWIASIFGALCACAVDAWMLLTCLLLQGLGVGGVLPLGSCLLVSTAPRMPRALHFASFSRPWWRHRRLRRRGGRAARRVRGRRHQRRQPPLAVGMARAYLTMAALGARGHRAVCHAARGVRFLIEKEKQRERTGSARAVAGKGAVGTGAELRTGYCAVRGAASACACC